MYATLRDHPDQWISHKRVIDIIFEQKSDDKEWYISEILAHHAFLRSQQEANPKLRGSFLAELYLLEAMWGSSLSDENASPPLPSMWPVCEGLSLLNPTLLHALPRF